MSLLLSKSKDKGHIFILRLCFMAALCTWKLHVLDLFFRV